MNFFQYTTKTRNRRKKIGIIGPNNTMCSKELYNFGVQFGQQIETKDLGFDGWVKEHTGRNLDDSQNELLVAIQSIDEILKHLDND